jgi:hypothetical protein
MVEGAVGGQLAVKNRTARVLAHAGRGGQFGIDQEVVTLEVVATSTNSGYPARPDAGRNQSKITGRVAKVLRATALSLSHLTWSSDATTT